MEGCDRLVSVIIPAYNDVVRLRRCLDAIQRQTLDADKVEVLVVDNGSEPPLDTLAPDYPGVAFLRENRPGSYNARNAGCRAASGSVLAFTDADCRPHPDWLEQALLHFERHPATAAIGGAIVLDRSAHPTAAELYEHTISFDQERFVKERRFAATANLLVRRSVFEAIGPFNGQLKSGGDWDWGQRLARAGFRMDYQSAAAIAHPPRRTLIELVRKRRRLEAGFREESQRPGALPDTHEPSFRPKGLRMATRLLMAPHQFGLRPLGAIKVLCVAGVLASVGLAERLRLNLGGVAER